MQGYLTPTFGVEVAWRKGQLQSAASDPYGRSFRNNFNSYHAALFLRLAHAMQLRHLLPRWDPYLFGGAGTIGSRVDLVETEPEQFLPELTLSIIYFQQSISRAASHSAPI